MYKRMQEEKYLCGWNWRMKLNEGENSVGILLCDGFICNSHPSVLALALSPLRFDLVFENAANHLSMSTIITRNSSSWKNASNANEFDECIVNSMECLADYHSCLNRYSWYISIPYHHSFCQCIFYLSLDMCNVKLWYSTIMT